MPNQPLTSNLYVNPLLTDVAQVYAQDMAKFVGHRVFGTTPVSKKTGYYPVFTKEYWLRNNMQKRAPGGFAAEGAYGIDLTNTYECEVWAEFMAKSNQDDATSDFDLGRFHAEFLMQQAMLNCESQFASTFFATSTWTGAIDTTPSTKWDASGGTPVSDIRDKMSDIETKTGFRPNTLVCGQKTHDVLQDAEQVVDRIKHISGLSNPAVTDSALASALGLDNVYRMSVTNVTSNESASSTTTAQLADEDGALLCYVSPAANPMLPSAGRMFTWATLNGGANEFGAVIKEYYSLDRSADIYEIEQAFDFEITAADLGMLFLATDT